MKKVDWVIHYVFDQSGPGNTCNAHTHGMENYSHPDFQLVLPYAKEHIMYLLNTLGMRVQAGETFAAGDMVKGLYEDCDIRLDLVWETGRQVLRLIIPDKHNRFPEDPLCDERYKPQILPMFEV